MADNAEKDKKDNSFMMKLATLIVDKRKGFYLIFIVLCIFCVLSMNRVKVNNDLTTYLPDTTETRRGLDLMDWRKAGLPSKRSGRKFKAIRPRLPA